MLGRGERPRPLRLLPTLVALLTASFATLTAGGCEVIVGETLPSTLSCTGSAPGECPPGQACGPGGQCASCTSLGLSILCSPIVVPDAGVDAGHDAGHDAPIAVDTGHDAAREASPPEASTPGPIGAPCTTSTSCAAGLVCVPVTDLTGLTLSALAICSRACCTNSDCGAGPVCYPTTGGNLCISASQAASCHGSCGTACCTDTNCTGGDYCAYGTTNAGSFVPSCHTFGSDSQCGSNPTCTGASNDACLSNSDCESNICVPGDTTTTCANSFTCGCWASGSCCNDAACSGQMTCQWVLVSEASNNSVVVRACNTSGGSTKSGESCTSTTMTNTCSGGICASFPAQNGDLCTQPCCSTSDCMGIGPGWICGPYPQQLNVGEVVLLVCQPTR